MPSSLPNLMLFFGHLHPMLVHLPIGFLTLLAVVEITARFKRFKGALAARGVIVVVTAVSTIITITCGLMLSSAGGYDPSLLFWHKWLGIVLGCGVMAAALGWWKNRSRLYGGSIIAALLLLGPASHFGGSMTHGKNYLTAYAPAWLGGGSTSPVQLASLQQPVRDAASANLFSDVVQPILRQDCLACHSANKSSGQLQLDSLALINRGGKSGPVIVAGHSSSSLILQRIQLPVEDPHHMPPQGKPQPGDDEIEALQWWIDSGAPDSKKVAELNPSADQIALVSRLMKLPVPQQPGVQPPVPLADLQSQIALLSSQVGIVVSPVAVDEPWLIVNASLNHQFGDSELSTISRLNANIIDLNLAGTQVTDAGLAVVAQMDNLAHLRLDRTAISDAGVAQLKHLKKLEMLNLYGTNTTDAALKDLAALPALRHLYVWRTKIHPTAAVEFATSKTDANKIAQMQKQIEKLQAEIVNQHLEVVDGIPAATQPTNSSATKPPASTK